jgi:hypothetical protein
MSFSALPDPDSFENPHKTGVHSLFTQGGLFTFHSPGFMAVFTLKFRKSAQFP